jgi:hypothetical protein
MMPFAHYWGIDEVGVFVIPAVLAIVLLRWAEKKARARSEGEEEMEKTSVDD